MLERPDSATLERDHLAEEGTGNLARDDQRCV
jgi:hypothetical protein